MGDLFQAWVGFRSFETADIAAVAAALRKLRGQGIEVEYVEGNRDFFLAGSPYADAFDRVVLETSFEVGGVRYLAVHGDGLNDRDWQYRFWRSLSKSAPDAVPGPQHPAARWPTAWSTRPSGGSRRPTSSTGRPCPRRPSAVTPSGGSPRATTCFCSATSTSPASGGSPAARCGCSTPGSGAGQVEWLR